MKIEYQETTSDLQTRIDIHGKYGGRDIDQWMLDLLQLQKGIKILDVGCGSGKQCFSYSKLPGRRSRNPRRRCRPGLLAQARETNQKMGSPVHFREVNFNKPFPFDSQQFRLGLLLLRHLLCREYSFHHLRDAPRDQTRRPAVYHRADASQ